MNDVDDKFYERADAHIHLSNEQITEEAGRGKVSASTMYSTATQKLKRHPFLLILNLPKS